MFSKTTYLGCRVALDELVRGRIDCDLAGHVDRVSDADGLVVRAARDRCLVGLDRLELLATSR
jgi:hypothetical protein